MKNAVILFSGGMDSTTCLAVAKSKGYHCHALSFNYGQRHVAELNAAKRIAAQFGANHIIMDLPIFQMGASALTDASMAVPQAGTTNGIPSTYVPARNTIFLSYALGWAEVLEANHIYIGVSSVDYSGYPDCRPEYIQAFQTMANLATKAGIEGNGITIETPLLRLSKADTIKLGQSLGVDYHQTVTCYRATAEGHACGQCDSCHLRQKGFVEAGLPDQTQYER